MGIHHLFVPVFQVIGAGLVVIVGDSRGDGNARGAEIQGVSTGVLGGGLELEGLCQAVLEVVRKFPRVFHVVAEGDGNSLPASVLLLGGACGGLIHPAGGLIVPGHVADAHIGAGRDLHFTLIALSGAEGGEPTGGAPAQVGGLVAVFSYCVFIGLLDLVPGKSTLLCRAVIGKLHPVGDASAKFFTSPKAIRAADGKEAHLVAFGKG